jgi:hypothetical protein
MCHHFPLSGVRAGHCFAGVLEHVGARVRVRRYLGGTCGGGGWCEEVVVSGEERGGSLLAQRACTFFFLRPPYKQQAVETQSIICQIKTEPSSWTTPKNKCALRAPDQHPSWRLHQLVLRIQPPYCSMWYVLGHLGAFNRQKVRRLRSHCSSTLHKQAHIRTAI